MAEVGHRSHPRSRPPAAQLPVRIPPSLEILVRPSPLLSAAAAVAVLAAVAAPATAAPAPAPAKGVASSTVNLVGLTAGGHTLSAGTLQLLSDMLGAESVAKILVTPLTADGKTYGQQTITPDNSPGTTPSASSSSLVPGLNGIAGLTSPVFNASSSNDGGEPSTSAGATSLGGLSLLGLPVALDGSLDVVSAVTKAGGGASEQTIALDGLALPSIADLLGALGLDLSALPVGVLNELLTELDLVTSTVTTANEALTEATTQIQTQLDAAQAEVDKASAALTAELDKLTAKNSELAAAEKDLAAKTAALAPLKKAVTDAQAQLAAANTELTKVTNELNAALASVGLLSLDAYNALPELLKAPLKPLIEPLLVTLTAAQNTVASATALVTQTTADLAAAQSLVDVAAALVTTVKGAIATLQATIDELQKVLDAAVAAVKNVLTTVQPQLDALLGAITAVLDGTPLVSFDSLSIVTQALATSNKEGGQTAKVTGGELSGLEVLGTDVLSNVLGTTKIDLLDLAGTQLTDINGAIDQLTATLSDVLSTVPGFPTLSIPAPEVGLLTKAASTDVVNGFGVADTSVSGLRIALPSVKIPTALALPGAADLPALDGITQVTGLLTSAPISMDLAKVTSNSRFAPAVTPVQGIGTPGTATPDTATPGTQTPGTAAPQLPRTGASQALAALAVLLMGAAVVARRRSSIAEDLSV
jgi:peptidoglycan hydrolase CwlO-like protein